MKHYSGDRESGAVLVETAIVTVLLFLFAGGIIDYGVLFGQTINVASAAQNGAEAGTRTTAAAPTDDQIIAAIVENPSTAKAELSRVIIYKAAQPTADPPAQCTAANPALPVAGCNIYNSTQIHLPAGAIRALDASGGWPSSQRQTANATADYLGVYVEAQSSRAIGAVWTPRSFHDHFVMRLEAVPPTPPPASPNGSGFVGQAYDPTPWDWTLEKWDDGSVPIPPPPDPDGGGNGGGGNG